MLKLFRATRSNVLVWILMGLLIIGLAGFGISIGGGLGSRNVANVGDRGVNVDDFNRAMGQELNSLASQLGRNVPMSEARQFGIDRMILTRLVNDAALDDEAMRLGISAGDDTVREQIMRSQAFQGINGQFDRNTYTYALQRLGLTPAAFEDMLRREAARGLITAAVQSTTQMPDTLGLTLLSHLGETRGFEWIRLDAGLLPEPIPAPTEADLTTWHEANAELYARPETQVITYAAARPAELAATIDIPEDEVRAAYDADTTRFHTPERRILDRIGFSSQEAAAAARARLDGGEIDFDALAAERGLSPAEIDQGSVAGTSLSPEAREAVFGHAGPGIVGPVRTALGPSIFRINAVLGARTTPFEEARAAIAADLALQEAHDRISAETALIDDLIAGGASLEEIAADTVMELGTVELNADTSEGIGTDPSFQELAGTAREGEESDLAELESGGLVALRIERIEPAMVLPLDAVRDRVAADWTAARTAEALTALAEEHRTALDQASPGLGALADDLSRPLQTVAPVARNAPPAGIPVGLFADLFEAAPGEVLVERDGDGAILVRLTEIVPFDAAAAESAAILEQLRGQFAGQAAGDLLTLYIGALRNQAGVSVNESLLETALAQFP